MNRKKPYLAGAALEFVRFAALSAVVRSVVSPSAEGELLFRAMILPQLFCAPALFFLWRDGEGGGRLASFVAFAKAVGAAAFLPFAATRVFALVAGQGLAPEDASRLGVVALALGYDLAVAGFCAASLVRASAASVTPTPAAVDDQASAD